MITSRSRRAGLTLNLTAFAFGNSEILPFEDARKLLLAEVHSTPKDPVNVVATSTQQLSALLRLPHLKPPLLDLDALFKSARHDQDVSTSILDLLSYYKVEHHPELLFNAGQSSSPSVLRVRCKID